jgi:hypothetical protein
MKRSALAMAAAIALALSVPGMASATVIAGVLDQSNPADTPSAGSVNWMAQTFTAGKSGLLTYVQLWLEHTDGLSVSIRSTTGGLPDFGDLSTSPTEYPTNTAGWVFFPLGVPVPMNAGTTYAIVFNTNQIGADTAYGSGDTYAGGQAYEYLGGSWGAVSGGTLKDFAFQTYVDPQTTTLQWDKAQVVVGVPTPLTLTETLVFPAYNRNLLILNAQPAVPGPTWSVTSVNLPTWFSVASVVCSSQILPADCTPANVAPSKSMNLTPDGNPVILTLTGSATATAVGAATGNAQGCVAYYVVAVGVAPAGEAQPAAVTTVCVSGQATVNVVAPNATPGPTPPPTSTDRAPAPAEPGFILWLLPFCLAAMGGSLFMFSRRQGRIR